MRKRREREWEEEEEETDEKERRFTDCVLTPFLFLRCPLWQERIMRRQEGKYQRGEDEEWKERKSKEYKSKGRKERMGWMKGQVLYKM